MPGYNGDKPLVHSIRTDVSGIVHIVLNTTQVAFAYWKYGDLTHTIKQFI